MSDGKIEVVNMAQAGSDDKNAWNSVVNARLDGVGFHTSMYILCLSAGLWDCAKAHRKHSEVEYLSFMDLLRSFVDMFGEHPRIEMSAPTLPQSVSCQSEAVDIWVDWEMATLGKLRSARASAKDETWSLDKMIRAVLCEIDEAESMRGRKVGKRTV